MRSGNAIPRTQIVVKISVVTAVYNRVTTIGHAIESVRAQTYPHVEHIVQDGGSTDGTLSEIHRLANGSTHLVSAKDSGLYDAINRGITRATGDVVGLMHSDDFFVHNRVLDHVADLFANPEVMGVYGDLYYVASDDPTRVVRYWRAGEYSREKLRYGWMPPHPTLYLRRTVFKDWGLYDTRFRIAADYDAILRYLVRGGIGLAYIPEVMVGMRLGGESNRTFAKILRKSHEDLQAIRRNNIGGIGTLALKNVGKLNQFLLLPRKRSE